MTIYNEIRSINKMPLADLKAREDIGKTNEILDRAIGEGYIYDDTEIRSQIRDIEKVKKFFRQNENIQNVMNENNTIEISNVISVNETISLNKSIKIIGNNAELRAETEGLNNILFIENAEKVTIYDVFFNSNLKGRCCIYLNNIETVEISGCKFSGYSKEFSYYKTDSAILLQDCKNITINNNSFKQFGYQYTALTSDLNRCITIQGKTNNANIYDNTFYEINQGIIADSDNINIFNNSFIKCQDNPVYTFGDNIKIFGNTFDTEHDEGVVISGGDYIIKDNTFLNVPNKSIAFCGNLDTVKIINNIFKPSTDSACFIFSRDNEYLIKDLTISENIFKNLNNNCNYYLISLPKIGKLKFNKNNITVSATEGQKVISFNKFIEYAEFKENIIQNMSNTTAIAMIYEPSTTNYFLIEDNILANCRIPNKEIFTTRNQILQSNFSYIQTSSSLSEGFSDSYPKSGTWKKGDFIRNTSLNDLGLFGWVCILGGSPGIWQPIFTQTYQTREGTPINWRNPRYLGDEFFDTQNKKWYKAIGLTSTDWKEISII